jgi:surfeit locus 1 family protein
MKLSLRPLLWPTLMSLPILALALGLGGWQLERREWKRDILDRIAANQAAPAVPVDDLAKGDPLVHEYGKAKLAGTFLNDKEFYLAARSLKDDVGLHVVVPVRTDRGALVMFDRGWIPSGKKDPASRAASRFDGRVEVVGVVRRSQKKPYFVPDNDPEKNFWFTVDVPLMRKLAGAAPDPRLDAFFLEADATPNPGGVPVGGQTHLDIPNDHLQYAITWFGIALALVGVYLAYHWQNGRLGLNGRFKGKA